MFIVSSIEYSKNLVSAVSLSKDQKYCLKKWLLKHFNTYAKWEFCCKKNEIQNKNYESVYWYVHCAYINISKLNFPNHFAKNFFKISL